MRTGQPSGVVRAALRSLGLVSTVGYDYSTSVKAGDVISTDPPAGAVLHHGDTVAAREWWRAARQQARLVGSPHQVALAESHLERVPEGEAVRPRRKRTTTPSPLPPDPAAEIA